MDIWILRHHNVLVCHRASVIPARLQKLDAGCFAGLQPIVQNALSLPDGYRHDMKNGKGLLPDYIRTGVATRPYVTNLRSFGVAERLTCAIPAQVGVNWGWSVLFLVLKEGACLNCLHSCLPLSS